MELKFILVKVVHLFLLPLNVATKITYVVQLLFLLGSTSLKGLGTCR